VFLCNITGIILGAHLIHQFYINHQRWQKNILHKQKNDIQIKLFMGWYLWTYHFISFNVNYRNALFSTILLLKGKPSLSCSQVVLLSSKNGETLPIKLTDTTVAKQTTYYRLYLEKYPNNCYVPNRLTH
jgi:hypothetical protein